MLADRTKLNTFEAIIIRSGFSIYSGWVTAATTLNFLFVYKSQKSPSVGDDGYEKVQEEADNAETSLSIKVLYFVTVLYSAFSAYELNPLYGLILIWTLKAIGSNQKDSNVPVANTCSLLVKVYGVIWLGITGFSIYEKIQGVKRGLLY